MSRQGKISVAIGIALVILFPVFRHYQLRFALASYIAELKAKGEPMDLAQAIPPPVPPEQNGVPFIISSITNLDHMSILMTNPPEAMRMVAPDRAMIGWQQPDIRSSDGTNTWKDLARELAAEKSKLDSFQSLSNHPLLDFNLDYKQGLFLPLPHLMPLRQAENLLSASALYNLHQGDVHDACRDLRTILALVKGLSGEPIQYSQGLRVAITHVSAAVTWEILQDPDVSESDLEKLQQDWQSLDFIKAAERTYLMTQVLTVRSLEHYRQNPDEQWQYVMSRGRIDKILFKNLWRWFWSYADEKRALQIYQVLIEATRTAEMSRSYQSAKWATTTNFARLGLEKPNTGEKGIRIDVDEFEMLWIYSEDAHDSFDLLRDALATETARNAVITAIAIKRYELQHQHLPGTLEELMPVFLKTVPIDWMDGKALRYHPKADGTFLLYSVGENGRDDGGNPSPNQDWASGFYWLNPYALDLVWPQPATPEKIQKYYADQARKHANQARKPKRR
jgi:hypothetical protein